MSLGTIRLRGGKPRPAHRSEIRVFTEVSCVLLQGLCCVTRARRLRGGLQNLPNHTFESCSADVGFNMKRLRHDAAERALKRHITPGQPTPQATFTPRSENRLLASASRICVLFFNFHWPKLTYLPTKVVTSVLWLNSLFFFYVLSNFHGEPGEAPSSISLNQWLVFFSGFFQPRPSTLHALHVSSSQRHSHLVLEVALVLAGKNTWRCQAAQAPRYHSARNNFERFRGFWELFSRFEFDVRHCENYFFERFEFLVCSKFNHMQRDCTCACAVACSHPHNSFSNVVASLTIHDNIFLCIYICI